LGGFQGAAIRSGAGQLRQMRQELIWRSVQNKENMWGGGDGPTRD
jgi:hypothetical protein